MSDNKLEVFIQKALELGKQAGGQAIAQLIEDAVKNEESRQIKTAVAAMLDAGLPDEKVIQMLQKHWNLRLTDARAFLIGGRNTLKMQEAKQDTI
ncbi:MAG: hypothetical protein IJ157_02310 [Clostridia bacterium]|nr:hypothetical protein [Clostridia bacterium]